MAYLIIAILAIACIVSFFYVPTWVFVIFVIIWLGWSIFALALQRHTDEEEEASVFSQMRKNDRGRIFSSYINNFIQQDRWLEERTAVLADFSESYMSLADDLKNAMQGNFEKANNYMRACDYRDAQSKNKYRGKIDALFQSNKEVLEKINDLIGQLAEIENSADDVDTTRVDDIIESLKEMARL